VPQRSRVTFGTVAHEWQAHVVPMYKHSTQKGHRHILAKHLLPRFGDKPLSEIKRQEVQTYVASPEPLASSWRTRSPRFMPTA